MCDRIKLLTESTTDRNTRLSVIPEFDDFFWSFEVKAISFFHLVIASNNLLKSEEKSIKCLK